MNITKAQLEQIKATLSAYLDLLEETLGAQYYSSDYVAEVDDLLKELEGQE